MRLDVYLHRVCILKSRTLAKEACDRGKVRVNGEPGKASRDASPGDVVRLDLGIRVLEFEVVEVPEGQVSRRDAPRYYRVLSDEHPDVWS